MEKSFLEECLGQGMSLDAIGELAHKHPSTVSYWLKKHGLEAVGAGKYARRGSVDRSVSTVRYWLGRYEIGIVNERGPRPRRAGGAKIAVFECKRHGEAEFILEGRGYYRCKRCRSEAVARRRRTVKQTLVDESGGACALCGYDRWVGALQFHHVEPGKKEFHLAHRGHSRSLAKSRAEIRKCVLLCANCHAEVESGFATLPVDLNAFSDGASG